MPAGTSVTLDGFRDAHDNFNIFTRSVKCLNSLSSDYLSRSARFPLEPAGTADARTQW
jgi:hypothetical protein